MVDALIRHRDGIVGSWKGVRLRTELRGIGTTNELWRWEPWVRAAVIDFDLLSHVRCSEHREADAVSLWHAEPLAGADIGGVPTPGACKQIVMIVRPDVEVFQGQLDLVEQYIDLRGERSSEILTQLGPQTAFWCSIANLHPSRMPRTLELLDAVTRFAVIVEMRFKHALACPRPIDYSPQLQPIVLTPGHGTLPSGHSTQAFMIAHVLSELVGALPACDDQAPSLRSQLMAQAARVAINRTVAGVHFPVDSAAGQLLGITLGEYFLGRCRGDASFRARGFLGKKYGAREDFDGKKLDQANYFSRAPEREGATIDGSESLHWLWDRALAEWDGRARSGPASASASSS